MKKIYFLLCLFFLYPSVDVSSNGNAGLFRKKKNSKTEQDSTKTKKRVLTYTKMFINDKSCQTEKGNFLTLHKVKNKVYLEISKSIFNREMLLASTISEASDNNLGVIGYKPKPPMHIKFMQLDSTLYLSKVNISPSFDEENPFLSKAMKLSSLDPILNSYKVVCNNLDSTAVVADVTSLFLSNYDELSPMGTGSGAVKITGTYNSSGSSLAEIKAFEDNVVVKSYLSYSVSAEMAGLIQLKKNVPMTMKVTRTLLLLPEGGMAPRYADSRIGIFLTNKSELPDTRSPIKPFSVINRWDIQPADTAAYLKGELVEPIKPIEVV